MRALLVLGAALGAIAGLVMGVVEHQRSTAATAGWTFYVPLQPGYADYLPAKRAPWFPGLLSYLSVGLVGGLLIAAILLAFGFRLSRVRRARRSARTPG